MPLLSEVPFGGQGTMKTYEAALWFNGANPEDKALAKRGIKDALKIIAVNEGYELGPVRWLDLPPDHSILAVEPPKEFKRGARCLVGEANGRPMNHIVTPVSGFTHELEAKDLQALRERTRLAHRGYYPVAEVLTDAECDEVINELGPETALECLRTVH